MFREDAMPSMFPFGTVIATKKAKGRTTRVSWGELGDEMSSIKSSIEHYTGSVSKGSEDKALNLQAISHKMMMRCMSVIAKRF